MRSALAYPAVMLRRLVVSNIVSLDGCFSGPGGDVMVMPFVEGFSEYNAERLRAASRLLLGRVTFEDFRGYWPSVADDDKQPEVEREISRLNNAIEKVVVSDTLRQDSLAPWTDAEIVARADTHERVAALKAEDGGDILVFGSHFVWNDLLVAGLVDELHLMVGPGVVGDGVPAFENVGATRLKLLGAGPLPNSHLVLLRYETV